MEINEEGVSQKCRDYRTLQYLVVDLVRELIQKAPLSVPQIDQRALSLVR
jgi:hypothetical protein